jgi:hypothetical protein
MPCFTPLKAFRSETDLTSTGKRAIIFKENGSLTPIELPCGQCIGCRLEKSRQWAIRCMHESQLHEENCFITLTIDKNQPIEKQTTLVKSDFQNFMKRLRKSIYPKKVSYYYCGEYGEKYERPHYHACIFGHDFSDKELFRESHGNRLYSSPQLNKLWGIGYCIIGDVTFESAAYVARYITKKVTGPFKDEHYCGRLPEYTNMSKKPAIGLEWIKKYHSDVYPSDEVILKGKSVRPARYYDKFYSKHYEDKFDKIKQKREDLAHQFEQSNESSDERTHVKHEIATINNKKLTRKFESNDLENNHSKTNYDENVVNYFKGVKNGT